MYTTVAPNNMGSHLCDHCNVLEHMGWTAGASYDNEFYASHATGDEERKGTGFNRSMCASWLVHPPRIPRNTLLDHQIADSG